MPPENRFNGNLTFTSPAHQSQFEQIQHRPLEVCKHVDPFSLYFLEIEESVNQYFDAIGWIDFAAIDEPAYYELVFEFYSMFYFNRSTNTIDVPRAVNFRLLGVHYNLSISKFNVALGFVSEDYLATDDYYDSFLDIPPDFDANEALALLTEMRQISYDPKRCKDIGIHSPALRYIH